MPVPVLAVAGGVTAIVFIIVCLQVLESRRLAARREAFAREAAQRGWRYGTSSGRGIRMDRFESSGPAGPWTAEVIERRGRKRPGVRLMRWWNGSPDAVRPADESILLLLPLAADVRLPGSTGSAGLGVFAQMADRAAQAAVAFGVDHHFGPLVSLRGRGLQRVDTGTALIEGFAVLSDRPDEARRRLTPELIAVLRQAFQPAEWTGRALDPPWVTICGRRIALSSMSRRLPQGADVAALVDAGTALARARA